MQIQRNRTCGALLYTRGLRGICNVHRRRVPATRRAYAHRALLALSILSLDGSTAVGIDRRSRDHWRQSWPLSAPACLLPAYQCRNTLHIQCRPVGFLTLHSTFELRHIFQVIQCYKLAKSSKHIFWISIWYVNRVMFVVYNYVWVGIKYVLIITTMAYNY